MRVPLPDGQYVDLVDRLNHAQMRRIRKGSADPELDSLTEGVAAMATGWLLRDVQGTVVPFPPLEVDGVPSASLDTVPADLMLAIGQAAVEIAAGGPDPKGTDGGSPSLPPAQVLSGSRRSSRMRTSSQTIQDGLGTPSSPPLGN